MYIRGLTARLSSLSKASSAVGAYLIRIGWVAAKELNLSYHSGETISITIYLYIYMCTHIMVTWFKCPSSKPVGCGGRFCGL